MTILRSDDGTTFTAVTTPRTIGTGATEVDLPETCRWGLFVGGGGGSTLAHFSSVSGPAFDATVPPPAAPTGLAATAGDGQVGLDWADNAEADLRGYDVYRGGTKVNAALLTASSYTDTGLTNGVEVCYTVRAVGPGGESEDSASKCATPLLRACTSAPPSSSCVTSSWVTAFTTFGPVTNM